MVLTPHILAGAAALTLAPNPVLGLIFAILSHYLMDFVPHVAYSIENIREKQWGRSLPEFLKVFLDATLGFGTVYLILGPSPVIFLAGFLAVAPDGLTFLHVIFPGNKLLGKHSQMHQAINCVGENEKIPVFLRIACQAAVALAAISLLLQRQILP